MHPVPGRLMRGFLEKTAGIDTRSLAAFRIGLAAVTLFDLLMRSGNVDLHYSEVGVLPSEELDRLFLHTPWGWTLHGSLAGSSFLFGIAVVAAAALLVGWRTRLATALTWLLAVSLHARNPMLQFGGDHLLRVLLFWGMFLPLGAVWSVDARGEEGAARGRFISVASGAILVQIALMYGFTGLFKLNDAWLNGDALGRALSSAMFAKPLGQALAGQLHLAPWLGPAIPFVEMGGAVALIVSGGTPRFRLMIVWGFAFFHLLICCLIETWHFQALALSALFLFLPGTFWDRFTGPQADASRIASSASGLVAETLAALLLLYVIAWNALSLNERAFARDHLFLWVAELSDEGRSPRFMLPGYAVERRLGPLGWVGRALGLYQRWDMFSSGGDVADQWHMVIGTLNNGERISMLEDGLPYEGPGHRRPSRIADLYPDVRWKVHFRYLMTSGAARELLAQPLADHWNRREPERQVSELEVLLFQEGAAVTGIARKREVESWFRSRVKPLP